MSLHTRNQGVLKTWPISTMTMSKKRIEMSLGKQEIHYTYHNHMPSFQTKTNDSW